MSSELDRRIERAKRHLYDLYAQRRVIREAEKLKNRKMVPREETQAKVVALIQSGLSVKSIAAKLNRTPPTIRQHLEQAAFEEARRRMPRRDGRLNDEPIDPDFDFEEWFYAVRAEEDKILSAWNAPIRRAVMAGRG